MDHEAIYRAYAGTVVSINDVNAFDKDGKVVSIEQSKVDTARSDLNKLNSRIGAYPSFGDQLDQLYWDKKNGTNKWVEAIDKVKSDNPKPSDIPKP